MPESISLFFIILAVSFIATFISSLSGGGSSMITIPMFLFLGVPFPTAAAIHQSSSFFWVLPAGYNYLKGRHINWKFLSLYAGIGLIGAYIGATLVAQVDEVYFRPIIGILIILLVINLALRKTRGIHDVEEKPSILKQRTFYLTAPILGFYESVFGSGNGIIFSYLAIKFRGNDMMKALGYYYCISFFWVGITAAILIRSGFFNWELAVSTIIGGILGGYFGSKFGRLKGNLFVKWAFIVVGTVLGLHLILSSY